MNSSLTPTIVILVIVAYFAVLLMISYFTSKKADNSDFFLANRSSPWYLVAIGMIGASLSGVTFISIPGVVGTDGHNENFSYLQVVLGYLIGYMIIARVLLPIYYKYNLTTIYGFLEQRLGWGAYKSGSAFFILSRLVGASFRLFLVATVLQVMIMDSFGINFATTVVITILLIWSYTYKGGIKTIVVTDTLQTVFMVGAVILTIVGICNALDLSAMDIWPRIKGEGMGQIFYFENGWSDPNNFFKQVISGALLTIVMTGLDQDMMQKNLTCKSLPDAQKNMFVFSGLLVVANIIFLSLGALMYIYAAEFSIEIPERSDQLYPTLAMYYLPTVVGILFLIGLLAAAYSSADSALTALTTAFCIDFLNFEKNEDLTEKEGQRQRFYVHIAFSIILAVIIIGFNQLNSGSVINDLFNASGYTYGPILALFCFAMWLNRSINPMYVIGVCIASPIISFILNMNSEVWFGGLKFGFLILLVNATITFLLLLLFSKEKRHG